MKKVFAVICIVLVCVGAVGFPEAGMNMDAQCEVSIRSMRQEGADVILFNPLGPGSGMRRCVSAAFSQREIKLMTLLAFLPAETGEVVWMAGRVPVSRLYSLKYRAQTPRCSLDKRTYVRYNVCIATLVRVV